MIPRTLGTEVFGRALAPDNHRPLIPFLKERWTSKSQWPAMLVEIYLYGVYAILFSYCSFMLIKRKVPQRTTLVASSILFLLASADAILTIYFFFHFVLQNIGLPRHEDGHWDRTLEGKFGLYLCANAIAGSLLMKRCYAVWQMKRIVVTPIILLSCGTAIGFISMTASQLGDKLLAASFITSAAANLSLTLLIATRMWWTSRKVRAVVKMDFPKFIEYAVSLTLDSGAIYSLSIFLYLLFHTLVIDASLTQIAGVAVTAMIIRNSHPGESLGDNNTTFTTTVTHTNNVASGIVEIPRLVHRASLGATNRSPTSDRLSVEVELK